MNHCRRGAPSLATAQNKRGTCDLLKWALSHKIDVSFDDHQGEIRFPMGSVTRLNADGDTLSMMVNADSEEALARTEQVLTDHLVRMAHKETLQIEWRQDV